MNTILTILASTGWETPVILFSLLGFFGLVVLGVAAVGVRLGAAPIARHGVRGRGVRIVDLHLAISPVREEGTEPGGRAARDEHDARENEGDGGARRKHGDLSMGA